MSTTDTQLDAVRSAIEPAVAALGCSVYDLELLGGKGARTLRLTVTRDGGVDLETITEVTQAITPIVDDAADINGSYLMEVSSPGIERTLRRPEHYAGALGDPVSVKFHTDEGPRRVHGVLRKVNDSTCLVETETGEQVEIALDRVTQARTVFEWGPQPRPGKGGSTRAGAKGTART